MLEKKILNLLRRLIKSDKQVYNHITIEKDKVSDYIFNMLHDTKPFMIARFGSVELDATVYPYILKKNIFRRYKYYIDGFVNFCRSNTTYENEMLTPLCNNAGFFPNKPELINTFSELMLDSLKEVDLLGVVPWNKEDLFAKEYSKTCMFCNYDTLEPYDYPCPWSKALEGKKVLVIHPFAKSIELQYKKRELLFANINVLPAFDLITLKAVQTIAGERTDFATWFDALKWMEDEIDKLDFDVAIIGCGAYGFPLAAHCKQIGKKAIHLGGATQILFGIKGKRWEDIPEMAAMMNEHWVRPLPEETPQKSTKVEGGCYW